MDTFAKPFEQQYHTNVTWVGEADNATQTAKLMNMCGSPTVTLGDVNPNEAPLLADRSCVVGYNLDLVPNFKHIAKQMIQQRPGIGPYYAATSILMIGLVWNTKRATKPTSWKDMWNPKYRGKVGLPDFAYIGQLWLEAINKLEGGNEDNITPGIHAVADFVRKQDPVVMHTSPEGVKLFQQEEIVIAPFLNARTFQLQDAGVPVSIEYVPNSIADGDGYVILNGTRYPELAQRFINITLDAQRQVEIARKFGYPPTNLQAQLPSDLERLRITPKELDGAVTLDWGKMAIHRDRDLERWNKEAIRS